MKKILLCCTAVLLLGCDQLLPDKKTNSKSSLKAGIDDAIDTVVVQGGKLRAGQRAADKIHAVDLQQQEDINEVMGN